MVGIERPPMRYCPGRCADHPEPPMSITHRLTAILPCNDLDASEAFYNRLGFSRPDVDRPASGEDGYRMLSDGDGGFLHLTEAVVGWLVPGANPFGLYLYTEDVDRLAAAFRGDTIEPGGPEDKPWGMYEFSLSDPDQTLVRIGWPSRLRSSR
jgi:predicted lactoylglutathione lyase